MQLKFELVFRSAPGSLTSGRSPLNPTKRSLHALVSYMRGSKLDVTSSLQGIRRLLLAALLILDPFRGRTFSRLAYRAE